MTNPNTPILVGAGLTVQKERDPAKAKSPVDLLADAAQSAFADTGTADVAQAVDTVASIRFITESPEARDFPFGIYLNPARTVANLLGLSASHMMLAATGGNDMPMRSASNSSARARSAWRRHRLALLVFGPFERCRRSRRDRSTPCSPGPVPASLNRPMRRAGRRLLEQGAERGRRGGRAARPIRGCRGPSRRAA